MRQRQEDSWGARAIDGGMPTPLERHRAGGIARRTLVAAAVSLLTATAGAAAQNAFSPNLIITSTVPSNGDLNPYGVAFVPQDFPAGGKIAPGDILVGNFNNSKNLQGTGSTIIKVTPNGVISPPLSATVFYQASGLGFSTALWVLQDGFVLAGSVPSTDGKYNTIKPGAVLVLDARGKLVSTITTDINAPWDMAVFDPGSTAKNFVANVG
jgi:hypothetical protein